MTTTPDWRAAAKARCEALLSTDSNGLPVLVMDGPALAHVCTDLLKALAELDEKDDQIERLKEAAEQAKADGKAVAQKLHKELGRVHNLRDGMQRDRNRLAARVRELEQQLGAEQQAMPIRFPEQSHD